MPPSLQIPPHTHILLARSLARPRLTLFSARPFSNGIFSSDGAPASLPSEVPVLASLPRRNQRAPALCGCKKHGMDLFGDHTSTCTAHSGATKAHDWAVGVLGPLFRTAGHSVRSQHQVTASAGQRRSDVEIKRYLQDAAGHRSLVFDLSITHEPASARSLS